MTIIFFLYFRYVLYPCLTPSPSICLQICVFLSFPLIGKREPLHVVLVSVNYCSCFLRINNANGLEIRSTGSQSFLTVANVTEEHYGNYTCVATNKLGITNASLFLYSKYDKGEGKQQAGVTRTCCHDLKMSFMCLGPSTWCLPDIIITQDTCGLILSH